MQYAICAIVALVVGTIYYERRKAKAQAAELQRMKDDAALQSLQADRIEKERDLTDAEKDQAAKVEEFRNRVGRFLDPDQSNPWGD